MQNYRNYALLFVFIRIFSINIIHQKLDNGNYSGIISDVDSDNSYVLSTINGKIRIISYKHNHKTGNYLNLEIEFTQINDKSYDDLYDGDDEFI